MKWQHDTDSPEQSLSRNCPAQSTDFPWKNTGAQVGRMLRAPSHIPQPGQQLEEAAADLSGVEIT